MKIFVNLFLDVTVSFSADRYYFVENLPTAELAVSVIYTQPLQRPVSVKYAIFNFFYYINLNDFEWEFV